jgi:hypothetical protein
MTPFAQTPPAGAARYGAAVPKGARNWLTPAAWVAAVSGVLLLLFPVGFPNYDTIYALVWGREIAHLESPDHGAALPPTPHPLTELWGAMLTPLGDGAITLTMIGAYVALGLIGYFVYRLGSIWFDRWIGGAAALIVLTRAPFLSNGLRAYIDLPYIALCLAALLVEAKKPRVGWPVLLLLALAGLLRPEAWLFAVVYLIYLSLDPERLHRPEKTEKAPLERADTQNADLIRSAFVRARGAFSVPPARLVVLALAGPILWVLFDLFTTGSPTYSWTGTKETVETLERQTGPVDLLLYGPRRLGEVLQWPGMVGAVGGVILGLAFLRRRSILGVAAAALALLAFAILACGGLAILPRYTMLAAAILAIFVGVALLGWRLLEPGHPWRRRWQVFAAIVFAMFLIWLPNQWDLDSRVDTDLTNQARIEGDLSDLIDEGAFKPLCGKIAVPNHRAVPRLAFGLEIEPTEVVSAGEERVPKRGYFVAPAGDFVIHNFILDPNDPTDPSFPVPDGFERVAANESWVVYRRC